MIHLPDFNYWLQQNHFHPYGGINSGQYVSWDKTGAENKVYTEAELVQLYASSLKK